MKNKFSLTIAFAVVMLTAMACSFSTANLGELKFAKDKDGGGAGTSFKPGDEIFAITSVNNAMGKNKVKFRLLFDKVEGGQAGAVAYKLDTTTDVEGSRPIWFNFSYPEGFLPGTYKTEVVLVDEDGKELDRKTGSFTIAGDNPNKTAKPDAPPSDNTNSESEENKDADAN